MNWSVGPANPETIHRSRRILGTTHIMSSELAQNLVTILTIRIKRDVLELLFR